MQRPLLHLALALALSPLALAHTPPAPIPTCEVLSGGTVYHEYVGYTDAGGPNARAPAQDGNVAACPGPNPQIFDYDGHHEFGVGVARLAVNTGDFATHGSWICIHEYAHHSGSIFALDTLGFGPKFSVLSDFSLVSPTSGPDCGDGQIMPCTNPPPPSGLPFPANAVEDSARQILQNAFEGICNPRDNEVVVESSGAGPSQFVPSFGPGIDGSYIVVIEADSDNGRIPTGGHVWTA